MTEARSVPTPNRFCWTCKLQSSKAPRKSELSRVGREGIWTIFLFSDRLNFFEWPPEWALFECAELGGILIRAFYKWEWRRNNIVNFTNPTWNCDFYVRWKRIRGVSPFCWRGRDALFRSNKRPRPDRYLSWLFSEFPFLSFRLSLGSRNKYFWKTV